MQVLFRAYPWHSLLTLLALLLAGLAEGLGLSVLLPLFNIAIKADAGDLDPAASLSSPDSPSALERLVNQSLDSLGIDAGIGVMLMIIVIGITLKSLLLLIARKQVGYTAARVATDLRLDMLRAVLRSRWQYFLDRRIGNLANSLASEAQRGSEAFVSGATVITFLIQAVIYAAVAFAVSWRATLLGLAAGLLIIGVSHVLVRVARNAGKKQTRLLMSLLARLTDTLQSVKSLKAMSREHLADAVLSMETRDLNTALRRQVGSGAMLSVAQEQMFTLLIAGGMFAALVHFDMPLATVMVLVMVLGRMLAQLGKAQRQYQRLAICESAFWSMRQAIEEAREAEEPRNGASAPGLAREVHFDAVWFGYAEHSVLKGASMHLRAGTLTTLTGPSGAGKTTLVDLLIGLLQPQSGVIRVDGQVLADIDVTSWRRRIGYVPQETLLLHDTLLHNVTLGDPQFTEADAAQALRAAGAWEFVSMLPEGIHSTVGERGGKLSGGQRQRIMIARALVGQPQLLILDEATAALDPSSAAAVCATMKQLRGQLTILAISHQRELIEAADVVYRLEDGQLQRLDPDSMRQPGADSGPLANFGRAGSLCQTS
ncbi:MAG: ABC transporter ATP-binding protein [Thiogranum sp.]|nr:ABC transporter ATP-binding protein [Thiogranum sp.]